MQPGLGTTANSSVPQHSTKKKRQGKEKFRQEEKSGSPAAETNIMFRYKKKNLALDESKPRQGRGVEEKKNIPKRKVKEKRSRRRYLYPNPPKNGENRNPIPFSTFSSSLHDNSEEEKKE